MADDDGRVPEVAEEAAPVVAILGSRKWPDWRRVAAWVWALADKYPQAVVLSGGIGNVDTVVSREAFRRGLAVGILRPEQRRELGVYGIREIQLLPDRDVKVDGDEPFPVSKERWLPDVYPDFKAAAGARSAMLVERATQVQVFHFDNSPGSWQERREAERLGRPLHVVELSSEQWRASSRGRVR